jgi:hypothetical protein
MYEISVPNNRPRAKVAQSRSLQYQTKLHKCEGPCQAASRIKSQDIGSNCLRTRRNPLSKLSRLSWFHTFTLGALIVKRKPVKTEALASCQTLIHEKFRATRRRLPEMALL